MSQTSEYKSPIIEAIDAYVQKVSEGDHLSEVAALFTIFDADSNNVIDENEYNELVKALLTLEASIDATRGIERSDSIVSLFSKKTMNINVFKETLSLFFSKAHPGTTAQEWISKMYKSTLAENGGTNVAPTARKLQGLWVSTGDVERMVAETTVRIMDGKQQGTTRDAESYAGSSSGRISTSRKVGGLRTGFADDKAALQRWWPSIRSQILKSGSWRQRGATIITIGNGMGLLAAKLGATMRKLGAAVVTIAKSAPASDNEAYLLDLLDSRNVLVCRPTYGLTSELFDAMDSDDKFRFGVIGADSFIPALLPANKHHNSGDTDEPDPFQTFEEDVPSAYTRRRHGNEYYFNEFGTYEEGKPLTRMRRRLNQLLSLSASSLVEMPTWIALKRSLEAFPGGNAVVRAMELEYGFPSIETPIDVDDYDPFGDNPLYRDEKTTMSFAEQEQTAFLALIQSAADLDNVNSNANVKSLSTTRSGAIPKRSALTRRFRVSYKAEKDKTRRIDTPPQCTRLNTPGSQRSFSHVSRPTF